MDIPLRSFDFLGGQSAPRASDGVGIRLLYRCGVCQRIWFQDGKRITLDIQPMQAQVLAQELSADLTQLPVSTCRSCLYSAGGGRTEIDEYGKGDGFGFSWEYPFPNLVHALLTITDHQWMRQLTAPSDLLPDIVHHPQIMRAVLEWFVGQSSPQQFSLLNREICRQLAVDNPPGFGQPGTQGWRWKGGQFSARCPSFSGKATLLLVIALPAAESFSFPTLMSICQSLACLTLLNSVVGERRSDASQGEHNSPFA